MGSEMCIRDSLKTRHSLIGHNNKIHRNFKLQPIESFMESQNSSSTPPLPRMQDLTVQVGKSSSIVPPNKTQLQGNGASKEAEVITCCPVCGRDKVDCFGSITLCHPCHNFAKAQVERPAVIDCLSGYQTTEESESCTLRAGRQMCKVCRFRRIKELGWTTKDMRLARQRYYRCTECPALVFPDKNKLLDHIDTHQDTRLACRALRCDKSFVTAHALLVHINQSHPRCNYPLCRKGASDHHHINGLRYSCSRTMKPEDARRCEEAPRQPGTTFFCPEHVTPLILTEYGLSLIHI